MCNTALAPSYTYIQVQDLLYDTMAQGETSEAETPTSPTTPIFPTPLKHTRVWVDGW